MTVSKDLVITCNDCLESETWSMSVLRDRTLDSVIQNSGFSTESGGLMSSTKHFCPNCNDRVKEVFYVYDGHGEKFLGEVEAWGIVDARQVAWDRFECENMVKRERVK